MKNNEKGLENVSPDVARKIHESEEDGGKAVDELKIGEKLIVKTMNRNYTIERFADGLYISGHPKYCPGPRRLEGVGSTWGGSVLKKNFIGLGMSMEMYIEGFSGPPKHTSTILGVEKVGI